MANTDADIDAALASLVQGKSVVKHRIYTDDEAKALELYDLLNAIKLEQSVVAAELEDRNAYQPWRPSHTSQDVAQSQRELLEARARLNIKHGAVENILQSEAVSASVTGTQQPRSLENELEYLTTYRDTLAMIYESLGSSLRTTRDELTLKEAENINLIQINRELAAQVLTLAESGKTNRLQDLEDDSLQEELANAQTDARQTRQRFRIIKGLTTGVIVGSGVDWAANEQLRNLVLDSED